MLKKLEMELGTTLIYRYRRKWGLTETGEVLYQYAMRLLIRMQDVKRQIQEIEKGTAGTVRIDISSACSNMVIDYVSMYRAQFPNVEISISSGNSEGLLKLIEKKEIDVALLLRTSKSKQYDMKNLEKQPYVVIIQTSWSSSFPSKHATFEQITQFSFILLGAMEGHSFHEDILKAVDEHHVKLSVIMECKDITMVVALVVED